MEDLEDLCLGEPGPRSLNGCPNTDLDGIADREDLCPDTQGSKETQGCPDSEGDGLADLDDHCPKLSGPLGRIGCLVLDTDADGLLTDEAVVCQGSKAAVRLKSLEATYAPLFEWLNQLRVPAKKPLPDDMLLPAVLPSQATGVFNF